MYKRQTQANFFAIDPVVQRGMEQSTPILWADLMVQGVCDDERLAVMTLAQQAGLRDGITFPWHGANGHVGLLSLITSTPRTRAQWLSAVPFLSWLSMHIFEAVVRVCLVGESSHDALSLRELEVCQMCIRDRSSASREATWASNSLMTARVRSLVAPVGNWMEVMK